MPWITDKNGERAYKVSAYVKEELPTWTEFYEDWYKNEIWKYDSSRADVLDPYWKISRRMYLITIACNQLNKMIFEDGYQKKLLKFISEEIFPNAEDIRFTCQPIPGYDPNDSGMMFAEKMNQEFTSRFVGLTDCIPPIYTVPNPNGIVNPFIDENFKRIDVTELQDIEIYPIIQFHRSSNGKYIYCPMMSHETQANDCRKIFEFMARPFREYFEGEGVGWKDSTGKLIEGIQNKHNCAGVGVDPAL